MFSFCENVSLFFIKRILKTSIHSKSCKSKFVFFSSIGDVVPGTSTTNVEVNKFSVENFKEAAVQVQDSLFRVFKTLNQQVLQSALE